LLASVDGFPKISSLPGDLSISNATSLADIRGFGSLTQVNSVSFTSLPVLTTLAGFEALTSSTRLDIENVPLLTSLAPFSGVHGQADIYVNKTAVLDLTGLDGITGGYFAVSENPKLTSLKGAGAVTTTTGLDISSNPKLTSIAALSKLTSVQGAVTILHNDVLASLTGLEALTTVSGSLGLVSNPLVATLAPLSALRGDVGALYVADMAVTDLHGLEGLQSVADILAIGSSTDGSDPGTTKLASLHGLDGITSAGSLDIVDNAMLADLGALAKLQTVSSFVSIRGNPVLKKLGLSGMTSVGAELSIYDNQSLSQCEGIVLANRLGKTCGGLEVVCQDICTCPGNTGTGTCP
jgi:hypothetical protein